MSCASAVRDMQNELTKELMSPSAPWRRHLVLVQFCCLLATAAVAVMAIPANHVAIDGINVFGEKSCPGIGSRMVMITIAAIAGAALNSGMLSWMLLLL